MTAKEQILHSAIELFSIRGFDGVSIREIAEHAKVHFASIRYHFGDKEHLYKACISLHGESRLKTAVKYLDHLIESPEDMKLRLSLALNETLKTHSENPHLSMLVLREVESPGGNHDMVLKRTMLAMTQVYGKFFRQCQEKGIITQTTDPAFLTQCMMGILHHFMRTEKIRSRILSHSPLKNDEFRQQIVNGIITLFIK